MHSTIVVPLLMNLVAARTYFRRLTKSAVETSSDSSLKTASCDTEISRSIITFALKGRVS